MIPQILTFLSFKAFGKPYGRGFTVPDGWKKRKLERGLSDCTAFWNYRGKVYLEPEEGVGVLCVARALSQEPDVFLLDKPVEIGEGVSFCVAGYGCRFVFSLYSESEPVSCKAEKRLAVLNGITPRVRLDSLYTVLYQEKDRGFSFKGERHPYWELTYADKGSLICSVDGADYLLEQGSLMFFRGGQFHSQKADGDSVVSFFTATFGMSMEGGENLSGRVIHADGALQSLMKAIFREYRSRGAFSDEMILCLLTQAVIDCERAVEDRPPVKPVSSSLAAGAKSRLVSDTLKAIEENLGGKLTVGALAARACVSASMLSKTFQSETGCGVYSYVRRRRMETAKELIRQGRYTITQIADLLGFCSVCYFSSEFKKFYSVTPGDFSRAVNQE